LSGLPAARKLSHNDVLRKRGDDHNHNSGQILYADAGYYSNIRAVVSGISTMKTLTLYAGDIEYKPRTLRAAACLTVVYTGSEITLNYHGFQRVFISLSKTETT
jgi:hypothetical protein